MDTSGGAEFWAECPSHSLSANPLSSQRHPVGSHLRHRPLSSANHQVQEYVLALPIVTTASSLCYC